MAEEVKAALKPLDRSAALAMLREDPLWDAVIVGGGATGAGIALDAASRGLKVALLEAQDFSAGTSSRSTKLIHGGVRYMKNPRDWGLVSGALHERSVLIKNCPQLVHAEPFVLPCFEKREVSLYAAGLALYGAMAGSAKIGRTRTLKADAAAERLPGVKTDGLLGGVEFFDAQFDDARLNVALVRNAAAHGAACLNYMPVTGMVREGGLIQTVTATDSETGEAVTLRTRMVFNCAGVWADSIRRMAGPDVPALLRFSRGTHVVVDRSFLSGSAGMLIPKTRDGRVLFAIPWHGAVLLGTTDIEVREADMNPQPSEEEIGFILETASGYLAKPVSRSDVLAAFAGLRPLLRGQAGQSTSKASREHAVIPEFGNMITVAGGKWTSYRRMAEDAMLEATMRHLIPARLCETKTLPIETDAAFDAEAIEMAAAAGEDNLCDVLAYARHAQAADGARTAEDVLWRRLRVGVLNAARAEALLPLVADALAGKSDEEILAALPQADAAEECPCCEPAAEAAPAEEVPEPAAAAEAPEVPAEAAPVTEAAEQAAAETPAEAAADEPAPDAEALSAEAPAEPQAEAEAAAEAETAPAAEPEAAEASEQAVPEAAEELPQEAAKAEEAGEAEQAEKAGEATAQAESPEAKR